MSENQTVQMLPVFSNLVEKLNKLVRDNSCLYLISDNYVSGDLVIQALINELNISHDLSYGYTMQAHYKGRCLIFKGSTKDCERLALKFRQYGITTNVEQDVD